MNGLEFIFILAIFGLLAILTRCLASRRRGLNLRLLLIANLGNILAPQSCNNLVRFLDISDRNSRPSDCVHNMPAHFTLNSNGRTDLSLQTGILYCCLRELIETLIVDSNATVSQRVKNARLGQDKTRNFATVRQRSERLERLGRER